MRRQGRFVVLLLFCTCFDGLRALLWIVSLELSHRGEPNKRELLLLIGYNTGSNGDHCAAGAGGTGQQERAEPYRPRNRNSLGGGQLWLWRTAPILSCYEYSLFRAVCPSWHSLNCCRRAAGGCESARRAIFTAKPKTNYPRGWVSPRHLSRYPRVGGGCRILDFLL